jgi:hypothetical protein
MLGVVDAVSYWELGYCRPSGLRILFFDGVGVEASELMIHLDAMEVKILGRDVIMDGTDVL